MPRSSFVNVELEAEELRQPVRTSEPEPFRILLLGDFGARAKRRPYLVDRDNFDSVMDAMQVQVGPVRVRELDDFHPDRLFAELEVFRTLRQVRLSPPPLPLPPPSRPNPELERLTPEQLFARMVDEACPPPATPQRALDDFDRLVREIVAPHVQPKPDPRQAEVVAEIDRAIAEQMRAILHHPEFQPIEAAWRALFFLVRRLETGPDLKLYILDVKSADEAVEAAIPVLLEQPVGSEPWSLVGANFTYGESPRDLEALAMLGAVGRAARAPVLAGASPRVLGCASLAESPDPRAWRPEPDLDQAWTRLRAMPEARWLALALPRFLLRLPYGPKTSAVESFDFDEMPGSPRHDDYLWGNPMFACVGLVRDDACRELEGLPAHVYTQEGESHLKPCAETWLTEIAAERILDRGLMPLVPLKGTDRARLLRFQSIAEPPTAFPTLRS